MRIIEVTKDGAKLGVDYRKFVLMLLTIIAAYFMFNVFWAGLVCALWAMIYILVFGIEYADEKEAAKKKEHADKLAQSTHLP